MKIETYKVKQYNSTYKHVLMVDGKPILITESANRINKCIAYLSDKTIEINDGTIKKLLNKINNMETDTNKKTYYASGMALVDGKWQSCGWPIVANSFAEAAQIANNDNTFRIHSLRDNVAY